ncbi:MAG: hypothetical protein REI11_18965 [Patulibacter sp.]|nr:hypothetical protein [Patulibacter sp.]
MTTTDTAPAVRTLLQAAAVDRVMDMIDRDLSANTKKADRLAAIQESIEAMLGAVSGVEFPGSTIALYHNMTSNGIRLNRAHNGDVVSVIFDPDIDMRQGSAGPKRELTFHAFGDEHR